MPYRVRPINWGLFLEPAMRGAEMRARSGEVVGGALHSGLSAIGQGIAARRQEQESRRRFDAQMGMAARDDERQDLAMLLQIDREMQDRADEQARSGMALDQLEQTLNLAGFEVATRGQASPETEQRVNFLTNASGGLNAAAERLSARLGIRPGSTTQSAPARTGYG